MILQWSNNFDPGHFAWYTFCTLALLAAFVPGTMIVCAAATRQPSPWRQVSHWLPILSGCGLVWLLLLFSLAFAPGPMKELPPNMSLNLDLRDLLADALHPEDEIDEVGRGGLIGSFQFAGLMILAPEGDPEKPGFPSRRPAHQVPLASFMIYQTAVFLAVIGGLGVLVQPFLSWPRVFAFLLLWSGLVYAPMAHWVWGDGWLALRGAIDPGGGLLPLTIGMAAAAVFCVGKCRRDGVSDLQQSAAPVASEGNADRPSNEPLTCGVLLLCLSHLILAGSFSVYVHQVSLLSLGMLNVLLAGAGGCVAWSLLNAATVRVQQADSGALGLMAGCAAAAGGAGVLTPQSSLIVGFGAAAAGFAVVGRTGSDSPRKIGRILPGMLAVPAALGLLMPGLLGVSGVAMRRLNKTVVTSLVDGDVSQLVNQLCAVAAVAALVFAGTAILLVALQRLPRREESPAAVDTVPADEHSEGSAFQAENR